MRIKKGIFALVTFVLLCTVNLCAQQNDQQDLTRSLKNLITGLKNQQESTQTKLECAEQLVAALQEKVPPNQHNRVVKNKKHHKKHIAHKKKKHSKSRVVAQRNKKKRSLNAHQKRRQRVLAARTETGSSALKKQQPLENQRVASNMQHHIKNRLKHIKKEEKEAELLRLPHKKRLALVRERKKLQRQLRRTVAVQQPKEPSRHILRKQRKVLAKGATKKPHTTNIALNTQQRIHNVKAPKKVSKKNNSSRKVALNNNKQHSQLVQEFNQTVAAGINTNIQSAQKIKNKLANISKNNNNPEIAYMQAQIDDIHCKQLEVAAYNVEKKGCKALARLKKEYARLQQQEHRICTIFNVKSLKQVARLLAKYEKDLYENKITIEQLHNKRTLQELDDINRTLDHALSRH